MDQNEFGKLIKEIRKKNNLTQKDLADKYNVTYQAVSKWENGKKDFEADFEIFHECIPHIIKFCAKKQGIAL